MLREPGARFFSAYTYYNKRYRIYSHYGPQGADGFAAMVSTEVGRFRKCRLSQTARRCARAQFYAAQQLLKGAYALWIAAWQPAFPASSLLVLRLEDYEASPQASLAAVLAFLRLAPPTEPTWRRMLAKPRANRQRAASGAGAAMRAATRALLDAFYAPFNAELARLMGDERYLWLDVPRVGAGNRTALPDGAEGALG